MEQPLDFLKSTIADFPGYDDDVARSRSDELVRSRAGEALAELQQRLEPLDAQLDRRAGDLLIRVAFANQAVYKAYDESERKHPDFVAISQADANAVEVADRATAVDREGLAAYLDAVTDALDRRDAVMRGTAAPA